MSLSLLLLLLPGIVSEEVCFNISNGGMEMDLNDLKVRDDWRQRIMFCERGIGRDTSCFINCTDVNGPAMFNDLSNVCYPYRLSGSSLNISSYSICALHNCTIDEVRPLILSDDTPVRIQERLVELHLLRHMCAELFRSETILKKLFITVERQSIYNIMSVLSLNPGDFMRIDLKYLVFNIFSISDASLSSSTNNVIQIPENCSALDVWLPADGLQEIPEDERLVNIVDYPSSQQFELHQEDIYSIVIRIEFLGKRHLSDLTTPVRLAFYLNAEIIQNDSRLQCAFFDEMEYKWKTDGCQTERTYNVVHCHCNHTTPFSVLLIREPIGEYHWQILSYITYIGCGLSAFFTALAFMVYVIHRKQREEPSILIHLSLSGVLFLLNSSFLLSEWGATVSPGWVCVLIAALIHYSLLGSFTWMAIEGLHLYLMLIKVFNTEYRHYLLKLSLFGWGIPAVVVGLTLSVKDVKQMYGLTILTVLDSNQTNGICWIMDDTYFYVTNVVYFTLVFIFNSGILLMVAIRICRLANTPSPGVGCRSVFTVIGLTCLLGTTWGLLFLGSGHINYPVLYLFCILNSTQGVFIFIWILCTTRKERKRAMEAKTIAIVSFATTDSKVMVQK